MIEVIKKIFMFIGVILFQVLILDEIEIGSFSYYFSPLVYGVFILTIKPSFQVWILLFIAFVMGLSVDIFRDTLGMHTSALLVVAIIKNPVLSLISPREGFDPNKELNVINIGINRFMILSGVLLFLHHFWFYMIEDFHLEILHYLILKSIINTAISLALIILFQYLNLNKN